MTIKLIAQRWKCARISLSKLFTSLRAALRWQQPQDMSGNWGVSERRRGENMKSSAKRARSKNIINSFNFPQLIQFFPAPRVYLSKLKIFHATLHGRKEGAREAMESGVWAKIAMIMMRGKFSNSLRKRKLGHFSPCPKPMWKWNFRTSTKIVFPATR